jgi:hypothetical protein
MNKILTIVNLFILLSSAQTFGQVVDDFTDGDFTSNPVWTPNDPTSWVVTTERLRSNSGIASSSFYISTPSAKATDAQWEFFVNLQFNTSSANFADVFLASDLINFSSASNNGYFIRIGGTPDEISLYKLTAGVASILINGEDGVTNSSNNSLRIKVVRDITNKWTLERDATGGTNYFLEGSATDNTFTTSNFFGIRIQQSSSTFFNKHFFDDLYVGNIIVESDPPVLQAVQNVSASDFLLVFSESLDPTSANTIGNFSGDNNIGNPSSATLQPDQKSIKLTFDNSFNNGVQNQISVTGVKDLVGNVMAATTLPFLYFIPQPAGYNDLVINELFPDPSPQIGLPAFEFVEILNQSTKPFDLSGWQLSDPSSIGIFPSLILLPGEYLTITSSAAVSSFTGKVIGISNFPTLNNSGDVIKLTDPTGLKIDSVNYSLAWYLDDDKATGGWTLERLNPQVNTNESTNWLASEEASGGTPGKENSVFGKNPDSKPPQLLSLTVVNEKELLLQFNEELLPSAIDVTHFHVNSFECASASLSTDGISIQLIFSTSFLNGVDYLITISGIQDIAGNSMLATVKVFRYFIPGPVHKKDLIISEIMADPSPIVQLAEAEYIEIFNRTTNAVELKGWKFSDATTIATLDDHIILPNEYLILTSTANASKFAGFGKVLGVSAFPSLNNSGESLVIRDETGLLIDSVQFSSSWYHDDAKKEGGWSLELIDPQNTCGEENNWIASDDDKGGTPGKQNSAFANKPDLSGPKLLSVSTSTSTDIVLTFDEKLEKNIFTSSFSITPVISIVSASFTDVSLRQIRLKINQSLSVGILYHLKIENLRDCNANLIQPEFDEVDFALPEKAESSDLLINEVLFNPKPNGVDFIEIYNRSLKYIDLKNWNLANVENSEAKNKKSITTQNFIIAPFSYLVFTEDTKTLKDHYPLGDEANFFFGNLPTMPDDEGSVALISDDDRIIDSFSYSKKFHSPLIKDSEGVSLERISFTNSTLEPANWKSATAFSGFATPGYLNSNARSETQMEQSVISVDPEIISFSGANEFTQIRYHFDESGYIANVKVYDHQGRSIKEITNNETLPFDGFLRWDGDNDDGHRTRSGYYLVWFEVFDLEGNVKVYRKRVVVYNDGP